MSKAKKVLWSVLGVVGVVVTTAVAIPPEEAISNLSQWVNYVGFSNAAGWLATRAADIGVMAVGAITFLTSFYMLSRPSIKKYSATQERIILYLGKISDGCAPYQKILRHCNIEDNKKEQIHLERKRLEWLGLVEYSDAMVCLTDEGWKLNDKLVQQEEAFMPQASDKEPDKWFYELLEKWKENQKLAQSSMVHQMKSLKAQREGLNQETRNMIEKYCDNEALRLYDKTFQDNYVHTRYETVEDIIHNLRKYLKKEWQ